MGKIDIMADAKIIDTACVKILATVSRLTDVSIREMRGKTRAHDAVEARRICMVLINDKLRYSCTRVGKIFNRDHATALHAYKVHANLLDVDKHYQEFYSICATAVGIEKMSDANDRKDVILKLGARIEFLEAENEELAEQIKEIKTVLT
jgi:hypothetical protein